MAMRGEIDRLGAHVLVAAERLSLMTPLDGSARRQLAVI